MLYQLAEPAGGDSFGEFTSAVMGAFGGYWASRCTWSSSPLRSTRGRAEVPGRLW